jgi:predicted small metal-binding protein
MARLFIDCRGHPSENSCTISIAADSKNELIEAAVQHAVAIHGHKDSKELREMIGKSIHQQV